jgi:hypothetical protein
MHAGILVRKSEAPGGCGWIVDFGAELGRQFFATGGASNVCHLAFANVRSSPNSPAAASPRSPVAPLGLQASPSRASQWAVSSVSSVAVSSVESSLMTLIGTSTRLKQQSSPQPPPEPHAQISNSIQVDLEASSQLSNISIQVANLAAQVRKIACHYSSVSARAFRQYAEGDGRVKSRWRSSLSTCSETPQQHACSETPQAPPTPQPPPSMTLRESRPWRPCTKWMKRRRQRMLLLLRLQVFLALNLRSVPLLVFCLCFCLCLCRLRAFRLSRKMDIFGLLRAANQKQKLMKHMLARCSADAGGGREPRRDERAAVGFGLPVRQLHYAGHWRATRHGARATAQCTGLAAPSTPAAAPAPTPKPCSPLSTATLRRRFNWALWVMGGHHPRPRRIN